jgi:glycosyltransferase A (GT-A) superfamily protein (DUF2064 family)/8-oxo-dGTP pyrophosphatase MutT (NUDIX family)
VTIESDHLTGRPLPRVLVMAKAPRPGEVKTRLCPPLGLGLAARLARAFIADVLTAARQVDTAAGLLVPPGDVAELQRLFPGTEVIGQQGHGLAAALEYGARSGSVLVSGDAPTYPVTLIRAGLDSAADLVLGPALDGGYCLVAMRRFHPAPFREITWSGPDVLDQTVAAARTAGLRVELLAPHRDVDTIADLAALDPAPGSATASLLADPDLEAFWPRPVPETIERRVLHGSRWRRLLIDRLADGAEYGYLDTPPAVWVVGVDGRGDTMLVRQYRHPVAAHPVEVPAGSIEPGEAPADAAARELREEVGGNGGTIRRAGGFFSSSAHVTLRGLVYVATGVEFAAPTHAAREGIELVRMPLDRAVGLAMDGELCEAQSALALIQTARYLGVLG